MEEAKRLGLTKSIGLSNFNQEQIDRIIENSDEKPAVLQIEVGSELALGLLKFQSGPLLA